MDCSTCHGTGEVESPGCSNEQDPNEEIGMIRERIYWPYACPVCGGSGYLEDAM